MSIIAGCLPTLGGFVKGTGASPLSAATSRFTADSKARFSNRFGYQAKNSPKGLQVSSKASHEDWAPLRGEQYETAAAGHVDDQGVEMKSMGERGISVETTVSSTERPA